VKLEKLEHVAAQVAAETVEEPLLGIDGEGWRFFRMEGTETFVFRPRALQRDVLLHDLQDVRLETEIIDKSLGKQTHTIGDLATW
jgi:hypothetical protein